MMQVNKVLTLKKQEMELKMDILRDSSKSLNKFIDKRVIAGCQNISESTPDAKWISISDTQRQAVNQFMTSARDELLEAITLIIAIIKYMIRGWGESVENDEVGPCISRQLQFHNVLGSDALIENKLVNVNDNDNQQFSDFCFVQTYCDCDCDWATETKAICDDIFRYLDANPFNYALLMTVNFDAVEVEDEEDEQSQLLHFELQLQLQLQLESKFNFRHVQITKQDFNNQYLMHQQQQQPNNINHNHNHNNQPQLQLQPQTEPELELEFILLHAAICCALTEPKFEKHATKKPLYLLMYFFLLIGISYNLKNPHPAEPAPMWKGMATCSKAFSEAKVYMSKLGICDSIGNLKSLWKLKIKPILI